MQAQSLSVKRAEVEFHNFASLGEPERAFAVYAEENVRRGGVIRNHLDFMGEISPFLEIGSNIGHTSYMLMNEFGAEGFALDLSSDSLRYGSALMDRWKLSRAPVRVAGDAANLPFQDGSLRSVFAFQMLSQFMDIEKVFLEVKRVLAPGGIFFFAEEPMLRLLSLRLYRAPYYNRMKAWERKLYDWGLLGYLVRDVIGAEQEESFGIRQNHSMYLSDWHRLIRKHFVAHEYEMFVPGRGWGERAVRDLAIRLDPYRSCWRAARLLGGTLAAVCRKADGAKSASVPLAQFEKFLRCPDCGAAIERTPGDVLVCAPCGYEAPNEGGVYTLLPSTERAELYPGDRADTLDFSLPSHGQRLLEGWYELEGVFGNRYRWIGGHAAATLQRVREGPQKLRVRGHVHDNSFAQGQPVRVEVLANGTSLGRLAIDRPGLFIYEAHVAPADEYKIEILASPTWQTPADDRTFTVNISMIRLAPVE
ncbi:MAG: class I SAM-dependent methyltransferase [Bryobacteraceae bacterium]